MTTFADPMDQRNSWRAAWQIATHDVLLAALCVIVAIGLLATALLPQAPAAGVADPIAYSRWQAEARSREGVAYDLLSSLELNNVAQAVWWRIALVGVMVVAALRLTDRVTRLIRLRGRSEVATLRDETRQRVMLYAPALADLGNKLREQRYRVVQPDEDNVAADRAPWAEMLSALLHLGLVLAATGLLLNLVVGWEATDRAVVAGVATPLHGFYTATLVDNNIESAQVELVLQPGDVSTTLAKGQTSAALGGINVGVQQITPGYRVSASTADGKPLLIRASNYVSPTTEVLITFSVDDAEGYVAAPDARLALAFAAGTSPNQPVRIRAYAMPSGDVLTDTVVQPQLQINDVNFQFKPARGAVIDARYQPGNVGIWPGAVLTVIGLIGGLIYPLRRIVIRQHGFWTEFYSSGRGAKQVVARLIEQTHHESQS